MNKKIVIIAGEESGDTHAAHLIEALLKQDPTLEIAGVGGKHMQKAGARLLFDLASYGVTGLTEVLWHLRMLNKAMKTAKQYLTDTKPDLVILVDSPGFNLPLAKFAKQKLGLKVIYYISPQIWAWKAKRLNKIRQNVDHMAVILPFEKKIYQEGNVPVSFVGHPLMKTLQKPASMSSLRLSLGLPLKATLVALLPGSRNHEIQRHMPVFMETARRLSLEHPTIHFVIPVAQTVTVETLKKYLPKELSNITLINGQAVPVIQSSDCVVVASGTASLECALHAKPMCIIYKASWLSYLIASKVIKVKYLGLCNLLQNQMMVPELIQYDCNPQELTTIVNLLLIPSSYLTTKMMTGFKTLKASLEEDAIDEPLLDLVTRYLHFPNTLGR